MTTYRHIRARRRQRGAAMAEAAIVMTTLLVFLGVIIWTRNSYGMKLDMQQQTRSSSLYYSSHGCSGDKGGAGAETTGTVQDSSPQAETAAKKSNVAGSDVASRKYNTATAKKTAKSAWAAVWDPNAGAGRGMDVKKQGLSRTVEASSRVTCNEPEYDSGWKDWFNFGTRFISGGIGTAKELFK